MAARDFYDIWYLLVEHGMEADFYLDKFSKKCASRGLNPADLHKKLTERLPQFPYHLIYRLR